MFSYYSTCFSSAVLGTVDKMLQKAEIQALALVCIYICT